MERLEREHTDYKKKLDEALESIDKKERNNAQLIKRLEEMECKINELTSQTEKTESSNVELKTQLQEAKGDSRNRLTEEEGTGILRESSEIVHCHCNVASQLRKEPHSDIHRSIHSIHRNIERCQSHDMKDFLIELAITGIIYLALVYLIFEVIIVGIGPSNWDAAFHNG